MLVNITVVSMSIQCCQQEYEHRTLKMFFFLCYGILSWYCLCQRCSKQYSKVGISVTNSLPLGYLPGHKLFQDHCQLWLLQLFFQHHFATGSSWIKIQLFPFSLFPHMCEHYCRVSEQRREELLPLGGCHASGLCACSVCFVALVYAVLDLFYHFSDMHLVRKAKWIIEFKKKLPFGMDSTTPLKL